MFYKKISKKIEEYFEAPATRILCIGGADQGRGQNRLYAYLFHFVHITLGPTSPADYAKRPLTGGPLVVY